MKSYRQENIDMKSEATDFTPQIQIFGVPWQTLKFKSFPQAKADEAWSLY